MGELAGAIAVAGALLLIAAAVGGIRRARARRVGRLAALDLPSAPMPTLRSVPWRLAGRPDAIRVDARGRWIPIEVKSRPAPRRGPPRSHRVQLAAYCLLTEAATGAPPPFGVLRYGDRTEVRLPWDVAARAELATLRAALDRPYRGEARPSPARCARCRWRAGCDRAALPAGAGQLR
jgi:CRISPR-associated exonuclease Cas4